MSEYERETIREEMARLHDERMAEKDAEIARLRSALAAVHVAIGEAPTSDDETLGATVGKIVGELRERVERLTARCAALEKVAAAAREYRAWVRIGGTGERLCHGERALDTALAALDKGGAS